ncbi:MAG: hypothetical protein AAFZ38_08010 [Myxococcota bacterium]
MSVDNTTPISGPRPDAFYNDADTERVLRQFGLDHEDLGTYPIGRVSADEIASILQSEGASAGVIEQARRHAAAGLITVSHWTTWFNMTASNRLGRASQAALENASIPGAGADASSTERAYAMATFLTQMAMANPSFAAERSRGELIVLPRNQSWRTEVIDPVRAHRADASSLPDDAPIAALLDRDSAPAAPPLALSVPGAPTAQAIAERTPIDPALLTDPAVASLVATDAVPNRVRAERFLAANLTGSLEMLLGRDAAAIEAVVAERGADGLAALIEEANAIHGGDTLLDSALAFQESMRVFGYSSGADAMLGSGSRSAYAVSQRFTSIFDSESRAAALDILGIEPTDAPGSEIVAANLGALAQFMVDNTDGVDSIEQLPSFDGRSPAIGELRRLADRLNTEAIARLEAMGESPAAIPDARLSGATFSTLRRYAERYEGGPALATAAEELAAAWLDPTVDVAELLEAYRAAEADALPAMVDVARETLVAAGLDARVFAEPGSEDHAAGMAERYASLADRIIDDGIVSHLGSFPLSIAEPILTAIREHEGAELTSDAMYEAVGQQVPGSALLMIHGLDALPVDQRLARLSAFGSQNPEALAVLAPTLPPALEATNLSPSDQLTLLRVATTMSGEALAPYLDELAGVAATAEFTDGLSDHARRNLLHPAVLGLIGTDAPTADLAENLVVSGLGAAQPSDALAVAALLMQAQPEAFVRMRSGIADAMPFRGAPEDLAELSASWTEEQRNQIRRLAAFLGDPEIASYYIAGGLHTIDFSFLDGVDLESELAAPVGATLGEVASDVIMSGATDPREDLWAGRFTRNALIAMSDSRGQRHAFADVLSGNARIREMGSDLYTWYWTDSGIPLLNQFLDPDRLDNDGNNPHSFANDVEFITDNVSESALHALLTDLKTDMGR